jgi:oligopeptide/dipeptide ABC transporter ATP-binding protein
MYLGHIVEIADTKDIYKDARHPYTRFLLNSVPKRVPEEKQDQIKLEGEPPSPINPPPGCPFAPRCPLVQPQCTVALPPLEQLGAPGHLVRCPVVKEAAEKGNPFPSLRKSATNGAEETALNVASKP